MKERVQTLAASVNYTRARVTRTRLFQNIAFFQMPPSAPKITTLTQLTLLQRKWPKFAFIEATVPHLKFKLHGLECIMATVLYCSTINHIKLFFILQRNRQKESDAVFNRIADSFVALFTSINPEIKDKFLAVSISAVTFLAEGCLSLRDRWEFER